MNEQKIETGSQVQKINQWLPVRREEEEGARQMREWQGPTIRCAQITRRAQEIQTTFYNNFIRKNNSTKKNKITMMYTRN